MPGSNTPAADTAKVCTVCSIDCAGLKRHKDARGRYFCDPCFTDLMTARRRRERHAAAPPPALAADDPGGFDVLSMPIETPSTPDLCPHCRSTLGAGAVVCIQCGLRTDTGQRLRTRVTKDREAEAVAARAQAAGNLWHPRGYLGASAIAVIFTAIALGFMNYWLGLGFAFAQGIGMATYLVLGMITMVALRFVGLTVDDGISHQFVRLAASIAVVQAIFVGGIVITDTLALPLIASVIAHFALIIKLLGMSFGGALIFTLSTRLLNNALIVAIFGPTLA